MGSQWCSDPQPEYDDGSNAFFSEASCNLVAAGKLIWLK
jgi:hypothetical protein